MSIQQVHYRQERTLRWFVLIVTFLNAELGAEF
jgi:hypothetical protein